MSERVYRDSDHSWVLFYELLVVDIRWCKYDQCRCCPNGQVRDADVGGDCRTTRPDFGRDRCGAAQAADSYQPQLALAFCRSTPHYSPTPRGVIPFASRLN